MHIHGRGPINFFQVSSATFSVVGHQQKRSGCGVNESSLVSLLMRAAAAAADLAKMTAHFPALSLTVYDEVPRR